MWDEVVERLEGDVPDDDTPFTSDDAPGLEGDGYFLGPWAPEDALEWFPEYLIEQYDGDIEPNPDGENLFLPADAGLDLHQVAVYVVQPLLVRIAVFVGVAHLAFLSGGGLHLLMAVRSSVVGDIG